MSFPTITGSGCQTCGQSTCGCSKVPQTSIAMQALPAPSTPCDQEGFPAEYYSTDQILWAGADNDVLGIKNGDNLTKVLNIIMQLLP